MKQKTPIALAGICVVLALAAGMLAAAGAHAADTPGIWTHRTWLWDFALSAVLIYMAAPLAILGALVLARRATSTGLCVAVTLGWYAGVFAVWMVMAWSADGAFPEW